MPKFEIISLEEVLEVTKDDIECLVCDGRYTEQHPSIETCPHCGNTDKMQTIYLMPKCPECEGHNLNEEGTMCWDCLAFDYAEAVEEDPFDKI